jgi:cell division protein FtsL
MDELDAQTVPTKPNTITSKNGATKAGDMNRYLYPTLIVLPLIVVIILILVTAMKFSVKIILVLLLLFVFIVYFMQLRSFNVIEGLAEQRTKKKQTKEPNEINNTAKTTAPTVIPMDIEPTAGPSSSKIEK